MMSIQEIKRCSDFSPVIYEYIQYIIADMQVAADISFPVVEEVVIHFYRDIDRLFAIHHETIHPTKACSYLAFWVRKLKPISDAFPLASIEALPDEGELDIGLEITDINEQVSIHIAIALARNCLREGRLVIGNKIGGRATIRIFDKITKEYLESEFEDEVNTGRRFENIVYDLRYRTFGPHHLTHMLTHIMREVSRECQRQSK